MYILGLHITYFNKSAANKYGALLQLIQSFHLLRLIKFISVMVRYQNIRNLYKVELVLSFKYFNKG